MTISGCMIADKKSQTKSKSQYQEEIEKDWRLILHDDTVHTIQEVCDIVARVSSLLLKVRLKESLTLYLSLYLERAPLSWPEGIRGHS